MVSRHCRTVYARNHIESSHSHKIPLHHLQEHLTAIGDFIDILPTSLYVQHHSIDGPHFRSRCLWFMALAIFAEEACRTGWSLRGLSSTYFLFVINLYFRNAPALQQVVRRIPKKLRNLHTSSTVEIFLSCIDIIFKGGRFNA